MANRIYNIGTLVKVVYDPDEKVPNIAAKKYEGTVHSISKRYDYGAYGVLLELDGAVSDKGVPYVFGVNDLEIV